VPRKKRPAGATDPRTFLYVLEPKFDGNGLPWMSRSWCKRYPYQWWDTHEYDPRRPVEERIRIARQNHKAVRICGACPVRKDCLEFALETSQPSNIWGGMTPKQRSKYKKELSNV